MHSRLKQYREYHLCVDITFYICVYFLKNAQQCISLLFLPATLNLFYCCITERQTGSCREVELEDSMTRWLDVPGVNRVPVFVSRFRTSAANVYVTFDLVAWRPAFNDIIRLYWTPWSFRPTWKINVSTRPTHRTRVYQRGMSQLTLERVSASRF